MLASAELASSILPPEESSSEPPVSCSVKVAVGGVELMSGFSVNVLAGVVTFVVAPAVDALVQAGFLFDVPVRFDIDRLDIELSSFDAAEAPSIPLVEVLE